MIWAAIGALAVAVSYSIWAGCVRQNTIGYMLEAGQMRADRIRALEKAIDELRDGPDPTAAGRTAWLLRRNQQNAEDLRAAQDAGRKP